MIPIRDVTTAMSVLSRNADTGAMRMQPVVAQYSNNYDETVRVMIRDAEAGAEQTIISNRIHPFFVKTTRTVTEEQSIAILREQEAGAKTADICRKHGISSATFYAWTSKFGGMEVSDAKKLRALEEENAKLKRLLAEAMLDNTALKDVLNRKW